MSPKARVVGARAFCAAESACWAAIQLSLCDDPAALDRRSAVSAAARNAESPAWAWSISAARRLDSAGSTGPTDTSFGIGTRGSIASAALGASEG